MRAAGVTTSGSKSSLQEPLGSFEVRTWGCRALGFSLSHKDHTFTKAQAHKHKPRNKHSNAQALLHSDTCLLRSLSSMALHKRCSLLEHKTQNLAW
jgi:hypothetical protein